MSVIKYVWVLPAAFLTLAVGSISCLEHPAGAAASGTAQTVSASAPMTGAVSALDAERDRVPDVAEQVVHGVVNISSTRVIKMSGTPFSADPFFRHFFGPQLRQMPKEQRQQSLGSGVIVSKEGIILTNNHVIEKADEVRVNIPDVGEFDAEILGSDEHSDLAVLQLDAPKKVLRDLQPLAWGRSADLRLGETVLAVGNPFGVGQTVTMGIVSAKGRDSVGIVDYENFIQTDAAINPGNSGGALVNLRGELVGINTAIISRTGGYQGIGFAIPVDMARPIMESLKEHGKVVRGFLGVGIQDLNRDLAQALDVDTIDGVVVTEVLKDSPAQKAGFERGDVILSVDGTEVKTAAQLRNRVAAENPGTRAHFDVLRNGKKRTLTAKLEELDSEAVARRGGGPNGSDEAELGGLQLSMLSDSLRQQLGISPDAEGSVVITNVEAGSAADRAGLQPGDVVLQVNRKPATSVAMIEREYHSGSRVLLLVSRGGRPAFFVLPTDGHAS